MVYKWADWALSCDEAVWTSRTFWFVLPNSFLGTRENLIYDALHAQQMYFGNE